MYDLISVIIIIYRVEEYLDLCIQSVLNQSYKNLEVILVDDGSDDSCPQICDKYACQDKRIKVLHKKNGGMDDARKAGFKNANGKYVGYIDGDDWIEKEMYERLYKFAIDYDVEVVESGVIDSCGDIEKRRFAAFGEGCYKEEQFDKVIGPYLVYSGKFFRHGISPYLVTKLFKKTVIEKYQLMEEPSKNILDDVMCTFPCIIESRSLFISHECYYHYRVRNGSAKRIIRTDIADVVKKYYSSWINRFEGRKESDKLEIQIQYFAMYLLVTKAAGVFDRVGTDTFLTPFGTISKKSKLVLYGAGTVGIHLGHYIRSVLGSNLVLWVDKNYSQMDLDFKIQEPAEIFNVEYDKIILAILAEEAANSARRDLLEMGISSDKILWINDEYVKDPMKLLKMTEINDLALL